MSGGLCRIATVPSTLPVAEPGDYPRIYRFIGRHRTAMHSNRTRRRCHFPNLRGGPAVKREVCSRPTCIDRTYRMTSAQLDVLLWHE
jgi:hypothetical protein